MALVLWAPPIGASQAEPFDARAAIASWLKLWSSYDLSLVDGLFLTDARVTYFSSEKEGLIEGIEALRDHHAGFGFVPGGRAAERELWVEDLRSRQFEGAAVVTGIWFFGRREERRKAQRGPFTFVYVREGQDDRIAHAHFSNYPRLESR